MTIMFKDHTGTDHDFDVLPEASRKALIGRAISHVLGNEVASIIVGWIRREVIKGTDRKADSVTTAEVQTFRADNAEAVKAMTLAAQDAKVKQILEGTLGVHVGGGSSVDPLTKQMLALARDEIKAVFKKQGWKFPTGEETFKAASVELDAQGWINRWLHESTDKLIGGKGEPNHGRLEREATRLLKAKAAKASAVIEKADDSTLAESLGL
jgi:hypothetical protein